jgi:hypothetical protein
MDCPVKPDNDNICIVCDFTYEFLSTYAGQEKSALVMGNVMKQAL